MNLWEAAHLDMPWGAGEARGRMQSGPDTCEWELLRGVGWGGVGWVG